MSFKFLKKIIKDIRKFDSDIETYKKVVKTPSMPSIAYVNWGIHLAELGEFELAEEKLSSSTMMGNKTPEAYIHLGILKTKERKFGEAKELYIKALRLDNNNAKAYCFLGNVLTEMKDYEDAEQKFVKAASLDPNNADIMLNWGLSFLRQRNFIQAKEKFQKAGKLHSPNFNAIYFLGLIDMELGEFDKAKEKFHLITSDIPNNHEAFYYLAYIFYKQGFYEQSLLNALKSLEIYPQKIETYMIIAENYMNLEKKDECLRYYELGEKECGVNYFFLTSWGISLQHFFCYEESKQLFQKAIEINDENELGFVCMGVSFYELKDFDNAISFLEKALKLSPVNVVALDNLGQIYFKKQDYQKAIEYFQSVLKNSAKMVVAYERIAKSYNLIGDIKKANEYYQKAVEYSPNDSGVHTECAKFLIEQQDYEQALKKLQNAYKIDNKNLDCLNLLFYVNYVLAKQNVSDYNKEKAILIAEEIIKNYPEQFIYAEERKELECRINN